MGSRNTPGGNPPSQGSGGSDAPEGPGPSRGVAPATGLRIILTGMYPGATQGRTQGAPHPGYLMNTQGCTVNMMVSHAPPPVANFGSRSPGNPFLLDKVSSALTSFR